MTSTINIKSGDDLRKWLEANAGDQMAPWARLLAQRAALRVFPLLLAYPKIRNGIIKQALILQSWRATYLSSFGGTQLSEETKRAARAASGASDALGSYVARAASNAAYAAHYANAADDLRATASAANAIREAADAAANAPDALGPDGAAAYAAVSADCQMLAQFGLESLKNSPLWIAFDDFHVEYVHPIRVTPTNEIIECMDRLPLLTDILGPNAALFDAWYQPLFAGQPPRFNDERARDFFIKNTGDDFWEITDDRSGEDIMNDIAAGLGWSVDDTQLGEEPELPDQGEGMNFVASNGELQRIFTPPSSSETEDRTQGKLYDRLKKRVGDLRTAMGNAATRYPGLSDVLDDYMEVISPDISNLDIDDVWISGSALISQARSFAALDPEKQVTEPLEPQQEALLGELALLHGAFIMGFEQGRALSERAGVPLLTPEEFRALLEHERSIVRWLLESDQYALSDEVRVAFERMDNAVFNTSESAEFLAQLGYPAVRNLLIFTARALSHAERAAGRLSLVGAPMPLFIAGTLAFVVQNYASIVGFSASTPELNAYIQFHLRRLQIDHQTKIDEIED